jgi:formylglycine-generating enzyme required for sulfatase activity
MSGNISEWCTDTYESYACEKQEKNAELYLVRGGSWLVSDYGCRVTYRGACRAGQSGRTLGFRIVLSSN